MNAVPWRAVVGEPHWRSGRGGLLGGDTARRTRWWELDLECGHHVQRTVRYVPKPAGVYRRERHASEVGQPPGRVRCEACGAEIRRT